MQNAFHSHRLVELHKTNSKPFKSKTKIVKVFQRSFNFHAGGAGTPKVFYIRNSFTYIIVVCQGDPKQVVSNFVREKCNSLKVVDKFLRQSMSDRKIEMTLLGTYLDKVAALDHEVLDDPVEGCVLVAHGHAIAAVLAGAELAEVLGRPRADVREQLHRQPSDLLHTQIPSQERWTW